MMNKNSYGLGFYKSIHVPLMDDYIESQSHDIIIESSVSHAISLGSVFVGPSPLRYRSFPFPLRLSHDLRPFEEVFFSFFFVESI